MPSNTDILKTLLADAEVQVNDSPLFASVPPPLPPDFDFDRIEGMMLGLAIGDALGTEGGYDLRQRRQDGFVICDYPYGSGYPSDDSQMAFLTLEQMLRDRGFRPERVSDCFANGRLTGIGMTVAQFTSNHRLGLPWEKCGPRSAGNDALMRIAPILIPHLRNPEGLWADAALCAMVTHNDSAALASAVAFVALL